MSESGSEAEEEVEGFLGFLRERFFRRRLEEPSSSEAEESSSDPSSAFTPFFFFFFFFLSLAVVASSSESKSLSASDDSESVLAPPASLNLFEVDFLAGFLTGLVVVFFCFFLGRLVEAPSSEESATRFFGGGLSTDLCFFFLNSS